MAGIRINNIKRSKEICADLEARFLEGERMTVQMIVGEIFQKTNYANTIRAQETVRGWLNTLKHRFTRIHNLWFGNLNDQGEYGICNTEAEYRYVITRYYNFAKGIVGRTIQASSEGSKKGMLQNATSEERIMLPKLRQVEEIG